MRGIQNLNLMESMANKFYPGTAEESLAKDIYFWRVEIDHFPIRIAGSDVQVYILSC